MEIKITTQLTIAAMALLQTASITTVKAAATNANELRIDSALSSRTKRGFYPSNIPTPPTFSAGHEFLVGVHRIERASEVSSAEKECARLLEQYTNAPHAQGRLYLALARCYASHKQADPGAALEHVIENAEKALAYPLSSDDACQAYVYVGNSLYAKLLHPRPQNPDTVRKRALVAYLKGMKLILDKAPTLQKKPVPVVHIFDVTGPTNSPGYQRLEQQYESDMQAHKEAMENNNLVRRFGQFKGLIWDLYHLCPGGASHTDEVAVEGPKIISDSKILKQLVDETGMNSARPK